MSIRKAQPKEQTWIKVNLMLICARDSSEEGSMPFKPLLACAAALIAAAPADAVILNYALSGDSKAYWQLDTEAEPIIVADGFIVTFGGLKGSVVGSLDKIVDVCFFNADLSGGFEVDHTGTFDALVVTAGPQLYSGLESNPTFLTGKFSLIGYDVPNDVPDPSHSYTLRVSQAVPEPASWAMMLAGFGLAGASIRRHRATARTPAS